MKSWELQRRLLHLLSLQSLVDAPLRESAAACDPHEPLEVSYSNLPELPFKKDKDGKETTQRDLGAFSKLNPDHTHFVLVDDGGEEPHEWGASSGC